MGAKETSNTQTSKYGNRNIAFLSEMKAIHLARSILGSLGNKLLFKRPSPCPIIGDHG